MTQHSKGDWKIVHETSIMAGDRHVASTGGYQSNFEDYQPENHANARLIVKSPKMYEMIKDIAKTSWWDEGTMEYFIEQAQELLEGIGNE